MKSEDQLRKLLEEIYGVDLGALAFERLSLLLDQFHSHAASNPGSGLSERDSLLICYPDQIREPGRLPLDTLTEFCERWLKGVVNCVHLLPFYPWSSDDGFSVIDYRRVASEFGNWEELRRFRGNFRLMFDAVLNHVSVESLWFQGFLKGEPLYRDYFIVVEGNPDLSKVTRPRALPLLTHFQTASGEKRVWTTFSPDQVDLNYHNPEVLLEAIRVLLFYVDQGAEFIRLDAIGYLWKEIGTSCINLPRTHRIVQVFRWILDQVAPQTRLITETNVPSTENLAYFGNGQNEAHLVYNFALPPLVLHAFQTGQSEYLTHWAAELKLPSTQVAFLNFLASHDGIGLNPARGILPEAEIDQMLKQVEARAGLVSYKNNPDGTRSPYELNVNFLDALSVPGEPSDLQEARFIGAHALMFSFMGLPAVYFHSLFGSRGWPEGVALGGNRRAINRQKLDYQTFQAQLSDPESPRSRIFGRLSHLLKARASHPAFNPFAAQRVLECGNRFFGIVRGSRESGNEVLCIYNLTSVSQPAMADLSGTSLATAPAWRDLISGREYPGGVEFRGVLDPYQVLWLSNGHAVEKKQ